MPKNSAFYVAGGTLSRDAPSYVEREADHVLLKRLMASEFCYVLTSRQMGKSSLMVRTATRLREAGVQVAVLDLTAIGQNLSAEQWYLSLAYHLAEQLDIEDEVEEFWQSHSGLSPILRWSRCIQEVALRHSSSPLVIFVDEVDTVLSLPFAADEFFAAIREMYNRRTEHSELNRLSFALFGVASPADLIRDVRTTPFNIGHRITLSDFSTMEADKLTQGFIAQGWSDAAAATGLKRVLYWTSGHPYLTQLFCRTLAQRDSPANVRDIDDTCSKLFLSRESREQDNNLLFVRDRILRYGGDPTSVLDLYRQVLLGRHVAFDETDPRVSHLLLAGLVVVAEGRLVLRNRIYAEAFNRSWVEGQMPDAEILRQRIAFRRGLMRSGLVFGSIACAMAAITAVAWNQSRRATISERNSRIEKLRAEGLAVDRAHLASERERQRVAAVKARGEAEVSRQLAKKSEALANDREKQVRAALGKAESEGRRARSLADSELKQRRRTELLLYSSNVERASRALAVGNIRAAATFLDAFANPDSNRDPRGFEWYYLRSLCRDDSTQTFRSHKDPMNDVIWSKYGIFAVDEGGFLRMTNPTTGASRILQRFAGGSAKAVARRMDGERIAVGLRDRIEVRTGNGSMVLQILPKDAASHPAAQTGCIAFSPDGSLLAAGYEDGRARIWDLTSGALKWESPRQPSSVISLAWSHDGSKLAAGMAEDFMRVPIIIWDAQTGRQLATPGANNTGHRYWVNGLAFLNEGKTLVSVGRDKTMMVWDIASERRIGQIRSHQHGIFAIGVSPDGRVMATGSGDNTVKLWDCVPLRIGFLPREIATLRGHDRMVSGLDFSPDGLRVVTCSRDASLKTWTVGRAEQTTLQAHKEVVSRLAWSPDGNLLATGGSQSDSVVRVWNRNRLRPVATLTGQAGGIKGIAFLTRSPALVVASGDGTIRVWSTVNWRPLANFSGPAETLHAMAVSPDERYLATGGQGANFSAGFVRLFDLEKRQEIGVLGRHFGWVLSLCFSPDSKTLVSGGGGGEVRFWPLTADIIGKLSSDVTNMNWHGTAIFDHQDNVYSIAFSKDGKWMATGSQDYTVKLWNARKSKPITTLLGHQDTVYAARFSPDGKTLATGSRDETVKLWILADHREGLLQEAVTLNANRGAVFSMEFAPDGKTLISGHDHSHVVFWDTAPPEGVVPMAPMRSGPATRVFQFIRQNGPSTLPGPGRSRVFINQVPGPP